MKNITKAIKELEQLGFEIKLSCHGYEIRKNNALMDGEGQYSKALPQSTNDQLSYRFYALCIRHFLMEHKLYLGGVI